jgi:hypothetical protein
VFPGGFSWRIVPEAVAVVGLSGPSKTGRCFQLDVLVSYHHFLPLLHLFMACVRVFARFFSTHSQRLRCALPPSLLPTSAPLFDSNFSAAFGGDIFVCFFSYICLSHVSSISVRPSNFRISSYFSWLHMCGVSFLFITSSTM